MRSILFKAKRLDNGEWVEGYVFDDGFIDSKRMFVGGIVITDYHGTADDDFEVNGTCFCEVNPDTICQYTGLTDKNGNKIWENDVVKCGGNLVVTWNEKFASWCLTRKGWMYNHFFGEACEQNDCEVIGNIFDNPDLLER